MFPFCFSLWKGGEKDCVGLLWGRRSCRLRVRRGPRTEPAQLPVVRSSWPAKTQQLSGLLQLWLPPFPRTRSRSFDCEILSIPSCPPLLSGSSFFSWVCAKDLSSCKLLRVQLNQKSMKSKTKQNRILFSWEPSCIMATFSLFLSTLIPKCGRQKKPCDPNTQTKEGAHPLCQQIKGELPAVVLAGLHRCQISFLCYPTT